MVMQSIVFGGFAIPLVADSFHGSHGIGYYLGLAFVVTLFVMSVWGIFRPAAAEIVALEKGLNLALSFKSTKTLIPWADIDEIKSYSQKTAEGSEDVFGIFLAQSSKVELPKILVRATKFVEADGLRRTIIAYFSASTMGYPDGWREKLIELLAQRKGLPQSESRPDAPLQPRKVHVVTARKSDNVGSDAV